MPNRQTFILNTKSLRFFLKQATTVGQPSISLKWCLRTHRARFLPSLYQGSFLLFRRRHRPSGRPSCGNEFPKPWYIRVGRSLSWLFFDTKVRSLHTMRFKKACGIVAHTHTQRNLAPDFFGSRADRALITRSPAVAAQLSSFSLRSTYSQVNRLIKC